MRFCRNTCFVLLAAIWILPRVVGADLRVVGSDLLGLEFTKAFYAFAGREGMRLALAFDGSRPGLGELNAGRADLALVVLPSTGMSTLAEYRVIPLGYHRVVVLVSAACPLEHLTFAQLATVFGAGAAGGTSTRWAELGVTGEGTGGAVVALAPEVGTAFALEYFRHAVLGGRDLKANVRRFADANALAAVFAGGERAVAVAATLPASAVGLKVLPIAADPKSPAYAPTLEHLRSGHYPLHLPLQLVFRPARLPALGLVLEFLLGEEAARSMEQADLVVLPAAARAEIRRTLVSGRQSP